MAFLLGRSSLIYQASIEDTLANNLKFIPQSGKIELFRNRMLMFNQAAVRSLRTATLEQVGNQTTQAIFAKFGYESALNDYRSLDQLFPRLKGNDKLAVGPIMHGWCGLVKVIPDFLELDRETKQFVFRGRWINSYEAAAHLESHGQSPTPVCFSLAGYGSAWCSQFFGIDLLEIERKCVACGDAYCEWEIRPWDAWGPEADPRKKSLKGAERPIFAKLCDQQRELAAIKSNMNKIIAKEIEQNDLHIKALCHDIGAPLQLALSNLKETLISGDTRSTHLAAWSLKQAKGVVERFHATGRDQRRTVSIARRPTPLASIIIESIEMIKDRFMSKAIAIENKIERTIFSCTDPIILRDHVIVNILSNAVKFSPRKSKITISADQVAPGQAEITISDQGMGIPPDVLRNLGQTTQLDSRPGTQDEKGSGQGLQLAYFFTKKLGGELSINSVTTTMDPINCGTSVRIVV